MVPVEHIFIEEIKKSGRTIQILPHDFKSCPVGLACKEMAPALGFEPRTKWLTATYSTAELCRSVTETTYFGDLIRSSAVYVI